MKLLDNGGQGSTPDFHGFFPIHYAAMYGWILTTKRVFNLLSFYLTS